MEWNGNFDMEYGRCQNGMENNLPYQFNTKFRPLYLLKHIYGCGVMMNSIVIEVFNFNTYGILLSTNHGTLVVDIVRTMYALHHSKYIAICSIDDIQ